MAHDHFKQVMVNGEDRTRELAIFAEQIGLQALAPGRYSVVFVIDLLVLSTTSRGLGQPYRVMDELRHLEGHEPSSLTKAPTPFTRKPLAGLWHKHYRQEGIRSFAINMQKALHKYGMPALESRVKPADQEPEIMTEEILREVIDDAVLGNYRRRAADQQMTGEWIVYAKKHGHNYYLALGTHGNDVGIFQRIQQLCVHEFPFLRTQLGLSEA
jgi:hypothetical protein